MKESFRQIRVLVRTERNTYLGTAHMPDARRRVSDRLNEDKRMFLNLTDVLINGRERCDYISINKNLIISIAEIGPVTDSALNLRPYADAS